MEMDQQRQIQEALDRTRPQLQQPTAEQATEPDDRMRQVQDLLGRTGQAVSQQLSRFTPTQAAPTTTGGPVNPNPTPAEVRAYITESAAARGIDPNIALRVANSEGGFEAARRGTFKTGSSWWPFQLHYGGAGYENLGNVAGMGNAFTKETGLRAWRSQRLAGGYRLCVGSRQARRVGGVVWRQGTGHRRLPGHRPQRQGRRWRRHPCRHRACRPGLPGHQSIWLK